MVAQRETGPRTGPAMAFAAFMATWVGRLARIVLGVVIGYVGLEIVGGTWGTVVALIGLVPIAASVFNGLYATNLGRRVRMLVTG